MLTRLRNGFIAFVIVLLAQFLIAGIQRLLGEKSVDFPASILAMAIVFGTFLACGGISSGVDAF